MLVVGLTGGIGSGKSTVGKMFREAGVPVICADELAREAVQPGSKAIEEIRSAFGEQVIDSEGGLDRAAMAQVVFQDAKRRKILEAIIHPKVEESRKRRLKGLQQEGHDMVVVDIPLLFEAELKHSFDAIIVVYVPQHVQEKRLEARNHMASQDIRARIDAQIPIHDKRNKADYVIDNTGTLDETQSQFEKILDELRHMAALKKRGSN